MRLRRGALLPASGRLLLGSVVAAFLAACASSPHGPGARVERSHRLVHPKVVVTAPLDASADDVGWVDELLPAALGRLSSFGLSLSSRVEVRLHGSHASFARDTGRTAPWLRAWAGYDVIHLLPPSTWRDASRQVRLERLTHELVHAATFQALGDEPAARRVRPPFWFQEGAASYIAQQEARRMPLSLVVTRAGDADPLSSAEELLGRDHYVAYAAAHHAVAWLVERHGSGVIVDLLRRARDDGKPGAIDRALEQVSGMRLADVWSELRSSSSARTGDRSERPAPELTKR